VFNKKEVKQEKKQLPLEQEKLEALFGKPFLDHKIRVFIPQKIGKISTENDAELLFNRFVEWFGASNTYPLSSAFQSGKDVRQEDLYVIEAAFNDTHYNKLKNVSDFIIAFNHLKSLKGSLVEVDNRVYWVN
jgi:hypothetical protein